MALAARVDLEESGLIRSISFPNRVRDARRQAGFETLRDFAGDGKVGVNYNRLAKIERGEVVPAPEEINEIATALKVSVGKLLIDTTSPDFDREKWAREHVEASLSHRGGDRAAMVLGAAMRMERISRGLSTTDLKEFGLPAATASRIENADRPLDRWDMKAKKAVANLMGVASFVEACRQAERRYKSGDLDGMLAELFSPEKIRAREIKRLQGLLEKLGDDVDAKAMLGRIEAESEALPDPTRITSRGKAFLAIVGEQPGMGESHPVAVNDETTVAVGGDLPVLGAQLPGGRIALESTDAVIARPEGAGDGVFAVRMSRPTLGPGIPSGAVLVADPDQAFAAGDIVVVRDVSGGSAMVMAVEGGADGVRLTSIQPRLSLTLEELTPDEQPAKVISINLA